MLLSSLSRQKFQKMIFILLLTNISKRDIMVSIGGEAVENSVGGRIAYLRKKMGMTQEEFANSICMSRSNLSNIEKDRFTITDRVIDTICAKFGVNESWLRSGDGEMFTPMTPDEEFGELIGGLLADEPESFRRKLVTNICKLSDDQIEAVRQFMWTLFDEHDNEKK